MVFKASSNFLPISKNLLIITIWLLLGLRLQWCKKIPLMILACKESSGKGQYGLRKREVVWKKLKIWGAPWSMEKNTPTPPWLLVSHFIIYPRKQYTWLSTLPSHTFVSSWIRSLQLHLCIRDENGQLWIPELGVLQMAWASSWELPREAAESMMAQVLDTALGQKRLNWPPIVFCQRLRPECISEAKEKNQMK